MSKKKLQEKVQELVSLREMAAELDDEITASKRPSRQTCRSREWTPSRPGSIPSAGPWSSPAGLIPRRSGRSILPSTTSIPNP